MSTDVAKLAKENNEVFLFTRGSADRKVFMDEAYRLINGNIREVSDAKAKLQGYSFDVVIDFLSYNKEQLANTLSVIEGLYTQYIFISSATVYEKSSEDEIISEGSTAIGNKRWAYAYNKCLCEEYLAEYFADKTDSSYTIIRPYVTYNCTRIPYPLVPRNNALEYSLIYRIKKGMAIPVFDNGSTVTTLTHSSDFAKVVVELMGNKSAYGEAFHIANDKQSTWGEVLDDIDNILDLKSNRINFTQESIYTAIPVYKDVLLGDKGTKMVFDNSKLHSVIPNFTFEKSLSEGLKETLDFYEAHPDKQLLDFRWMGQVDKLCSEKHSAGDMSATKRQYITYMLGYYKALGKLADFMLLVISKIKG